MPNGDDDMLYEGSPPPGTSGVKRRRDVSASRKPLRQRSMQSPEQLEEELEEEQSQRETQPFEVEETPPPLTPASPQTPDYPPNQGTVGDFTMFNVGAPVVAAQQRVDVKSRIITGLKELIFKAVRETYITRKLNNYGVIIELYLKTIDDNFQEYKELCEALFPSQQSAGGKKYKIRKNGMSYKQNRFRKKNQKGGLCNDNTMINFGDYITVDEINSLNAAPEKTTIINNGKIITTTDKKELLKNLFKVLFMADNNKDFNLRKVINDLIHCLRAASNFKEDYKIDLDKDTLYKEVIDVIDKDASLGSMVLFAEELGEMVDDSERFQMHPDSLLLMDGTPSMIGSTIEKDLRTITLADVFDSAGTQVTSAIDGSLDLTMQINKMNEGLAFLLTNYNGLNTYIESIEVLHAAGDLFNIKFTLNGGLSFEVKNIRTGSSGVLTVEKISEQIKKGKNITGDKNLDDLKTALNAALKTAFPLLSDDDIEKIFNIMLIYFKAAGDFMKIWFGFKLGSVPNFLTTQDIMFFVITMFINFYHTDFEEVLNINKQTYVILGTGKTIEDGKKVAFVNDDEFYISNTIQTLVRDKIREKYECDVEIVPGGNSGGNLKITLFLEITKDGYKLVSSGNPQRDIPLIIYNKAADGADKPIDPNIDPSMLKSILKESKKKFAEIMKEVENAISLVDNVSYNEKISGYISPIKTKTKVITSSLSGLNTQLTRELLSQGIDPNSKNKIPNLIRCSTRMLQGLVDLENHVLTYFDKGNDLGSTLEALKSLNASNASNASLRDFFKLMNTNIGRIKAVLLKLIIDETTESGSETSLTKTIDNVKGFVELIITKYEEYINEECINEDESKIDVILCNELNKNLDAYRSILESVRKNEALRQEIIDLIASLESAGAAGAGGGGLKSYKKKYISKKINNPQNILIYKKGVVKSGKDVKVGKSSKTIKDVKPVKTIKDVKEVKVSKDKTVKDGKTIKDVKDVKVSKDKTVKSSKTVKDVKEVKVSKDKTVKSSKTVKDVKEVKVSKGKTVKDVKNIKDGKEVKVSKGKTVKDVKTIKDGKEVKVSKGKTVKEVKDKVEKKIKTGKEKITKNILGKDRRVYKITGDRKEYVKYKNELITVKEYIKRFKSNTKTNKKINGTRRKIKNLKE